MQKWISGILVTWMGFAAGGAAPAAAMVPPDTGRTPVVAPSRAIAELAVVAALESDKLGTVHNYVWQDEHLVPVNSSIQIATTSAAARTISVSYVVRSGQIINRVVSHVRRDETGALLPLQWGYDRYSVSLDWPDVEGVMNWQVRLHDEVVASPAASNATVPQTPTGGTYTVLGDRTAADGNSEPYIYQVTVPAHDTATLGRLVTDKRNSLVSSNRDISEGLDRVRQVHWNSFIPQQTVDVAAFCQASQLSPSFDRFGGDDRGFLAGPDQTAAMGGAKTSRIHGAVGSYWAVNSPTNPNPGTYDGWAVKYVGTSHAYNSAGQTVATENAGTAGLRVDDSWSDNYLGAAVRKMSADIANPLCRFSPSINWKFTYLATREGWISVSGTFDQAPSTEITWMAATSNQDPNQRRTGCWFRRANRGFTYLAPPAPNAHVDLDMNPGVTTPSCPTL